MRKSFDPHECIAPLNEIKRALQLTGLPFTKETILRSLKGCKLPINGTFWVIFSKSGIIQKVSKGMYMFTSEKPIYEGLLAKIKKDYIELNKRYNSSNQSKVQETDEDTDKIVQAIDFLESKGYVVFQKLVYTTTDFL